jgi:hypothetical protein
MHTLRQSGPGRAGSGGGAGDDDLREVLGKGITANTAEQVEKRHCRGALAVGSRGKLLENIFAHRGVFGGRCGSGSDHHVCAEGTEFGAEAAAGIDLKIQKGGGHGRTGAQSEQDHEQAATIRDQQAADDAPEHGTRSAARVRHRIGPRW